MSEQLTLPREAIKELISDGIREYESRKGENRDRGNPELGAVLRKHMDKHGQSLRLLSERSGVSSSMITKVISGVRMPSYEVLSRWRRALGDAFLIEWFNVVEQLDTASRLVGDTVYLTIAGPGHTYIIRQSAFDKLVARCMQANKRVYGKVDEAKCRREIDTLVREQYREYGELVRDEDDDTAE